MNTQEKYSRLLDALNSLGSVLVAFSAGVDSTFLLAAAREALGERAIAATAASLLGPEADTEAAAAFCAARGVEHVLLRFDPFAVEGFAENPPDRCYSCKKALFSRFLELAAERGVPYER